MIDQIKNLIDNYMNEFLEFWTPVIMISVGAIVFILETIGGLRAAYGRYNKRNLGFSAPIAWLIQESPAFILPFLLLLYRRIIFFDFKNGINTNFILLCYFLLHYFNRSFIYTRRIKSTKKVNFLENALAFLFCIVNGIQIGHYHTNYSNNSIKSWNFWLGSFLFFSGFLINIDSDNRLIKLRSSSKTGYKIPQGGLFKYVSAANYFGECIEWLGFAIASWSLPGLAFSLFTFANIGPRAYHHHIFYKELFGKKYPNDRKALIPFLI